MVPDSNCYSHCQKAFSSILWYFLKVDGLLFCLMNDTSLVLDSLDGFLMFAFPHIALNQIGNFCYHIIMQLASIYMQDKILQAFSGSFFQFWYKWVQGVKKFWFCRRCEIFIFHPILMGSFAFDSSQWEFSVVCQQIFSIFYRFRVIRGQSSGGRGIQFC